MKAVMVMFDSLSRRFLPPYGCKTIHAPNFTRLYENSVCFDNSYVTSVPCMPARRDLHTGRANFLHRSWGPIEPYDDSMPEILKNNGIYTHLVTDHYHYWEDGGLTYHSRYSSYELVRGQEGDPWKGVVKDPDFSSTANPVNTSFNRCNFVNRLSMDSEEKYPQAVTFELGLDFIKTNHESDNWFLQIETFDPHEPFFVDKKYKDLYPDGYQGPTYDWPPYARVTEPPDKQEHLKNQHFALISMCDQYLGKVLDAFDQYDLWKDTMLIVNTDHGYMLTEHGYWAKCHFPIFNEIANTPLFLWDPRYGIRNQRRQSLVQTIDLAPTLFDYFGVLIPEDMLGKPLACVIESDMPVRKVAIFGIHGGQMNITDGRYVYMRSPKSQENTPLYEYWLMPTHHGFGRAFIELDEIREAEYGYTFSFTKGCRLLRTPCNAEWVVKRQIQWKTMLFDLESDPAQENPIKDEAVEKRMIGYMVDIMKENDAPPEQYTRLGLK